MKQRVRCTDPFCESKCRAVVSDCEMLPEFCIYTGTSVIWKKHEKPKVKKEEDFTEIIEDIFNIFRKWS